MTNGSLPLAKAGAGFLPPLLRKVRQQLRRRGAGDLSTSSPASVDRELDEAIQLLLGENDTFQERVVQSVKATLTDRPQIFDDDDARDWLRRDDVQALLKHATLAFITDQPIEPCLTEAKRLYGMSSGDADWPAQALFDYAVSFLALTLKAHIAVDTRLLLAAENSRDRGRAVQLDRIETKIDGISSPAREQGLRWLPVDFGASRGLSAALLGQMLGPADVDACPRLLEADTLIASLDAVGFARLAGVPGAGKSICMLQVAHAFLDKGWRVVRLDDPSQGVPALLESDGPVLHLIDDAHLASPADLRRLEERCGGTARLLSALTIVNGASVARGTVHLDAKRAVRSIADALQQAFKGTFEAVRRLDDRIGTKMGDERLEDRLRTAAQADYPWQFCFILSGGWRRAKAYCASARAVGADRVLAALAIRQLATRDARCSPEDADRLLQNLGERESIATALEWLVQERLLLSPQDLRCPHQRFGVVLVDATLSALSDEDRVPLDAILKQVLEDEAVPPAGLATLLHELRFAHANDRYGGWSRLIDHSWLEPALARCWAAKTPLEIRDAAWFLGEVGGVRKDEGALFSANQAIIASWISACPPGACYALGRLANHVFNEDEDLGKAVRGAVDLASLAKALSPSDPLRTAEVVSMASSLRVQWEPEGRSSFLAGFDEAAVKELISKWPRSTPLSYAASIITFLISIDEDVGLGLIEPLMSAAAPTIQDNPIEAFHELDDLLMHGLRLLDVLEVYKGKLAPSAKRRAAGRKVAAAFGKADLGAAISQVQRRDCQSAASLLSFLNRTAPRVYKQAVQNIDWTLIEALIGDEWLTVPHDLEILLGCASRDPVSRAAIRQMLAPRLTEMATMPARFALMLPDLAIEQVEAGRSINFDRHWDWAAILVAHFSVERPDLVERLIEGRLPAIASNLSKSSPTYLNEILLFLRVVADVAPTTFEQLLGTIEVKEASIGWSHALKGTKNNQARGAKAQARNVAAFLIEKSLARQDALGALARALRKSHPRASTPSKKILASPGPMDRARRSSIDHPSTAKLRVLRARTRLQRDWFSITLRRSTRSRIRGGSVNLESRTDQEIETWIGNHERLRQTSAPLYRDLLEERVKRAQAKHHMNFDRSLDHLKQAAIEQRCTSYGALAEASGVEWSRARHQMNGPNGHLDRLLDICHARGLPLLTAICVNQHNVADGELGSDALAGFVAGAQRLGIAVTDPIGFHHQCRNQCWAWGATQHA